MLPKPPFKLSLADVDKYLAGTPDKYGIRPFAYPPTDGTDPELIRFLDNIQGNILQPHGRTYAKILLFAFDDAATANPPAIATFLARAARKITRATRQYSDAGNKVQNEGMEPFISLTLTHHGITVAGRTSPPEGPGGNSFLNGMYKQHARLGDTSDASGRPATWDQFYAGDPGIDGAWLIAHKTPEGLAGIHAKIERFCQGVASIVNVEDAITMRDADGFAREPFGFRDGISMPKYFADAKDSGGLVNPALEQLLFDSNGPETCCSFMVFRKLEQDVDAFRAFEKRLGARLEAAGHDIKDPGSLIIGRDRDGRPLAEGVGIPESPQDVRQVQFSFRKDMEGMRCPFSAHIRKAFFRQPQVDGGVQEKDQLSAQFVRRGMLFGAPPTWDPDKPLGKPVGLHFMAYMSSIFNQFEVMQTSWFRGPGFPVPGTDQPDPVLFGGDFPEGMWSWPQHHIAEVPIQSFVTPRGGAYLFVPSVSWLLDIPFPPWRPAPPAPADR